MSASALQQQLDDFLSYATGDVLIWHDPTGVALQLVELTELPSDVALYVEQDIPRFELLCSLNNIAPDERALVIRVRRKRIEEDDWFADLEVRADSFEPDLSVLPLDQYDAGAPEKPEPPSAPVEPITTSENTCKHPSPAAQSAPSETWYARDAFLEALNEAGMSPISGDEEAAAAKVGYILYNDCAIRSSFSSPADYYRTLFTAPLLSHSDLSQELQASASFKTFLTGAQANGSIFDYDEETWITPSGLRELEIERQDLDAFAQQAVTQSMRAGMPQFTVPWLRSNATSVSLLAYELSDAFYESVLLSRRRYVTRGHLAGRRIFAEPHVQARGRDLLESLLKLETSLNIDDLYDILYGDYGICITHAQLVQLIRATNLFYSSELDRVYVSHEQFIREVE